MSCGLAGGAGSGGRGGARPQGERMTILGIDPGGRQRGSVEAASLRLAEICFFCLICFEA
jgi:hypothetical protein